MSPGVCTLGYRRPVGLTLMGEFVGQSYTLKTGEQTTLNFDPVLTAGVNHQLWKPDKKGEVQLHGRLYLVDGNGHLLAELFDAAGRPAKIGASVLLTENAFLPARHGKATTYRPRARAENLRL